MINVRISLKASVYPTEIFSLLYGTTVRHVTVYMLSLKWLSLRVYADGWVSAPFLSYSHLRLMAFTKGWVQCVWQTDGGWKHDTTTIFPFCGGRIWVTVFIKNSIMLFRYVLLRRLVVRPSPTGWWHIWVMRAFLKKNDFIYFTMTFV